MKAIQTTNTGALAAVLDQPYNSLPIKRCLYIADISQYIPESFMKEIQSFSEKVTRLNTFIAIY